MLPWILLKVTERRRSIYMSTFQLVAWRPRGEGQMAFGLKFQLHVAMSAWQTRMAVCIVLVSSKSQGPFKDTQRPCCIDTQNPPSSFFFCMSVFHFSGMLIWAVYVATSILNKIRALHKQKKGQALLHCRDRKMPSSQCSLTHTCCEMAAGFTKVIISILLNCTQLTCLVCLVFLSGKKTYFSRSSVTWTENWHTTKLG